MPLLAGACSVSAGPLQHRTSSYSVAGPLQSLAVHARVGNVHVTGEAPGSKVTVTEHLTFRKTAPVTTHRTAARVLTLSSTCPSLETCSVSYDVGVPRTMIVRITNNAGTIELRSVSGPITATGSAGSIVGEDVSSARTIVRVATGQIKITFSAPPTTVRATTSAGLVLLRVPGNVGYAVDASTTVGAIRIGVQRSAASPHVITARATTGSIRIEPAR
jgi:hypothetical protein